MCAGVGEQQVAVLQHSGCARFLWTAKIIMRANEPAVAQHSGCAGACLFLALICACMSVGKPITSKARRDEH